VSGAIAKALHWLGDTLAKRLFWLLWAALVVSHLVAFLSVSAFHGPEGLGAIAGLGRAVERLPPMPGLPPLGGPLRRELPPDGPPPLPPPEPGPGGFGGFAEGPPIVLRESSPGAAPPDDRFAGGGPPWTMVALDLGIRMLLIALAAWLGSRWLAKPVARLVRASHRLGDALAQGKPAPQVDETRGTREVREAAQVFNQMARQLKHQFDARGLMISAISHDLRTPLTRMRMRLETGDAAPALRERCVADIREMDGLIDSVLELFRSQHAVAPRQRTDVAALVQSIVDDLAEQGAAVSADTAQAGDAVAPADPLALKRVLGNLIGNGLRYGLRVRVALRGDDDALRIVVDDDGPGIPPDQLDAVFEPFVRVEASRNRASGGVGLGLFIARELMRHQGGELRIANRSEGGLRAEVRLPRQGA
jgi:signal transduction histidine kinase